MKAPKNSHKESEINCPWICTCTTAKFFKNLNVLELCLDASVHHRGVRQTHIFHNHEDRHGDCKFAISSRFQRQEYEIVEGYGENAWCPGIKHTE